MLLTRNFDDDDDDDDFPISDFDNSSIDSAADLQLTNEEVNTGT